MELPSTCHYVHIIGSLWDYEGEGCYYPGSNCLVNNDQCVSVFKDTGCRGGDKQYQCAQVYYQKKQTTILEQQTPPQVGTSLKQENVELKLQLQNMQRQIEIISSKQATVTATVAPPAQPTPLFDNPSIPYSLLGILIIGIMVLMKMKIITLTKGP